MPTPEQPQQWSKGGPWAKLSGRPRGGELWCIKVTIQKGDDLVSLFVCRRFADHGGVPPKVLSSQSDFLPGVDSRPSDAESLEMTAAFTSSLVQVATRDKVTSRGQGTFYVFFPHSKTISQMLEISLLVYFCSFFFFFFNAGPVNSPECAVLGGAGAHRPRRPPGPSQAAVLDWVFFSNNFSNR